MSDLKQRLREACNGHPQALIPWPHRILHEAAEAIERLEKRSTFLEKCLREARTPPEAEDD